MNTSKGQKRGLTESEIKKIKRNLGNEPNKRDICLFSVQLDTMLRSSDVLSLTVADVQSSKGLIRKELNIKQQKTKKTTTCVLQEDTRSFLKMHIIDSELQPNDYLFTGHKIRGNKKLSLMGHTKLVKKWVEQIGLDVTEYSTHTLRRSKATIIYRRTNNIEVVRQLLGHENSKSTSKYLGIEKSECLEIASKIIL